MVGSIIMLVLIILFTVIGFIVGLVKGFSKTKTWAIEFVLSTLLSMAVGALTRGLIKDATGAAIAGILTIISAIAFMLIIMLLARFVRNIINKHLDKRKEEGQKGGGLGVFNRVMGGFSLAFKGFVMSCILVLSVSTVIDLIQIESLKNAFLGVYESAGWLAIKPHIFDFVIVGILFMAVCHGFESGIINSLWSLVVLGLVVGAGFASYNLAFNTPAFAGAGEALGGKLAQAMGGSEMMANMGTTLAKVLITIGLFILFAILIAIIAKFVPRILNFVRTGKTFYVVDGVIGAIVSVIVVLAILLFIGSLIEPLYGMEFMLVFDSYFDKCLIANFIYTDNILLAFGMPSIIPIKNWLS